VRTIDRETRRLDAIERGEPPPVESPSFPPSTAALPSPAMPNTLRPGQPIEAPLPGHEPRRLPPKAVAPRAPAPTASPVLGQQAAPLPPPIEVRPAPGQPPAKPKPPHAPLVLTPSNP